MDYSREQLHLYEVVGAAGVVGDAVIGAVVGFVKPLGLTILNDNNNTNTIAATKR